MLDILTEKNARKRMEREVRKLRRESKQTTEIKDQENKALAQQFAAQVQEIEMHKKQLAAAKNNSFSQ